MAFNKTFNQEEVARLKKLIQEGDQVLHEVDALSTGLRETVKAIAEEMDMGDEHAYVKDTHIAKIKQLAGMDTIMEDNSNEVQLPPSYMMMQNAS